MHIFALAVRPLSVAIIKWLVELSANLNETDLSL